MNIVLAFYGTRGDVEPGIALGRELVRRGHRVRIAVPPDLVAFAESVGLDAVAYGPDNQAWLESTRDFWARFFRNVWRLGELRELLRQAREPGTRAWADMGSLLAELTDGADLLVSGMSYQELALNVAEFRAMPMATLLWFPIRVNGHLLPQVPAPVVRAAMTAYEWVVGRGVKTSEDTQRRTLGLPATTRSAPARIAARGGLEIQAYEAVCFPGLAAEWAQWNTATPPRRPFVGTLTLDLPTDDDDDVTSWIEAGTPPIFFGFGSIPVQSPTETIAMIAAASARLDRRALVGAGWSDFDATSVPEHVKVVGAVNFSTVFPACCAVVHHGGAGTTAASLRAGVPTLILWMADVQMVWGAAVKRLEVGTARRFSSTTEKSMVADLRTILDPGYRVRAREVASQMTPSALSRAQAADRIEEYLRAQR